MNKKLHNPIDPRLMPWVGVLLSLISFYLIFVVGGPPIGILDSVFIALSYINLITFLWMAARINLFNARHQDIKFADTIVPVLLGAIFVVVPTILGNELYFNFCDLNTGALALLLGFGLTAGFVSELIISFLNKDYQLQVQALGKFPLDQSLTIDEIAIISFVSKQKVRRALGYQENVPASVAREWLENVKGIRCPPVEKKQLDK